MRTFVFLYYMTHSTNENFVLSRLTSFKGASYLTVKSANGSSLCRWPITNVQQRSYIRLAFLPQEASKYSNFFQLLKKFYSNRNPVLKHVASVRRFWLAQTNRFVGETWQKKGLRRCHYIAVYGWNLMQGHAR